MVVFQLGKYRIIELEYHDYDLEELKGDCYKPECNPECNPIKLKSDEHRFERDVFKRGVYGYELQEWNPEIDCGWEHLDCCWGFVGKHENENHYIVDEFKEVIFNETKAS